MSEILIIEPFYGGSHKQMVDLLQSETDSCVITMPAKKWHWRARTSALYLSQQIPFSKNYRVLFASSVLNLSELVALRPDLQNLYKILYFHENQLIYPVKKQQDRDFQYGYNQILSCLAADVVVFNSKYNMESFLSSINSFLKLIPDHRPKGLPDIIRPKCRVLYFPLNLSSKDVSKQCDCNNSTGTKPLLNLQNVQVTNNSDINELDMAHECSSSLNETKNSGTAIRFTCDDQSEKKMYDSSQEEYDNLKREIPHQKGDNCDNTLTMNKSVGCNLILPLHIIWAHRWEHDKDPETFFTAMSELSDAGCNFHISVLGEQFTEVPDVFMSAKEKLSSHIVNWGYQESKDDYMNILNTADVAVSTAVHEFFGVSMLEAVYCGCYPLCPKRLVYPEIFPDEYLYSTTKQMVKTLKRFCKFPALVRDHTCKVQIDKYLWKNLSEHYMDLLKVKDKQEDARP